jgi:hypothetical protein
MKKLTLLMIFLFMLFGAEQVHESSKNRPVHVWTKEDSKAYAMDVIHEWSDRQFVCLEKLWTKESNWRPEAYNDIKVMGKNAGGIPQMLGMSPSTPPTLQIERGFKYIMYRYGTPCQAWKYHLKNGWY